MTLNRRPRWLGVSLFGQVLALMFGALLAAQVLFVLTILALPAPTPVVYPVPDVIRAYKGEPHLGEQRPLQVVYKTEPKPSTFVNDPSTRNYLRRFVARGIGEDIDARDIVLHTSGSKWIRNPVVTQMFQQAVQNERPFVIAPFEIAIRQPDGRWKVVRSPPSLILDPIQQRALIFFFITLIGIVIASFFLARRLAAPIVSFAEAADRLGRDPRSPPLQMHGSAEIITAAKAFNEMQQRLRRYVEDRTAMVGAIAHDLRTPLTRLRFRIEAAPEDVRAKMASDLDEMEAMISATLSFVRDATQDAKRTKLELSSLLESLADEMAETGSMVEVEHAEKVVVEGDPIGLKRLFSNLLENAVKYGSRARARVYSQGDAAIVEIDDDGPGVPARDLERVFEPFYRREPSRSRETGGMGLGLAVVRTIARAHGGDAELRNREGGGLTARVTLPT